MAKIVDRMSPDFATQSYVVEAFKGVVLTSRQFMRNLFGRKEVSTVQYPEDRRPYTARFRGRHRLMRRPDEQVRCVACMLCATACPANCITIVAAEHDDKNIEKYPTKFEIDLLKCIYCGFCEEACPCDAIRMDSGFHMTALDNRSLFIYDKEKLMSIPSQDGTFLSENPRHEPGDPTHPGIDRLNGHH